jgi:hypothetical protein
VADKWIADGMIRWGPKDAKDKGDVKIFYPGDTVIGPDDDEMKQLIEAGAVKRQSDLQKREAPGEPSDMENELRKLLEERDAEIARLQAKLQAAEADKKTQTGGTTAGSGTTTKSTTSK